MMRVRAILIAVLMAAQLALALHSVEHKFDIAPSSDHCALCQVAATTLPGPAANPIAIPTFYELTQVAALPVAPPRRFPSTENFRSRAPPAVSV
jgi:hypothetical protein